MNKSEVDSGIEKIVSAIAEKIGIESPKASDDKEVLWGLRKRCLAGSSLSASPEYCLDWLAACFDFRLGIRDTLHDLLLASEIPSLIEDGLRQILAAAVSGFSVSPKNRKVHHKALLNLAEMGDFYISVLAAEGGGTAIQRRNRVAGVRDDMEGFYAGQNLDKDYVRKEFGKYLKFISSLKE